MHSVCRRACLPAGGRRFWSGWAWKFGHIDNQLQLSYISRIMYLGEFESLLQIATAINGAVGITILRLQGDNITSRIIKRIREGKGNKRIQITQDGFIIPTGAGAEISINSPTKSETVIVKDYAHGDGVKGLPHATVKMGINRLFIVADTEEHPIYNHIDGLQIKAQYQPPLDNETVGFKNLRLHRTRPSPKSSRIR